jgi:hypothetical protein
LLWIARKFAGEPFRQKRPGREPSALQGRQLLQPYKKKKSVQRQLY